MRIFKIGRPLKPVGIPVVDLARIKMSSEFLDQFNCSPSEDHKYAGLAIKAVQDVIDKSAKG